MPLPLQIFEERYRAMTRELLESGGEFGVLLIKEGHEVGGGAIPCDVGTTAVIEECTELPNGRFALTARGRRRFRLDHILPPKPYPFGEITFIEDDHWSEGDRLLRAMETVRATFPVYRRMALSLSDQWERGLRLPTRPHELVNYLAPWIQVDEQVKQRLLEIEPAPERVAQLAEILDDLIARTREEVLAHQRKKWKGLGSGN
jgi:Lon protease-like protein